MDKAVIQSVLDWLNGHDALAGIPVELERLPADGKSGAMLQSLQGDPIISRYRSGGYIGQYPFAVILRTPMSDTAGRLDAMEVLGALWDAVEAGDKPTEPEDHDYIGLEITSTPARTDAHEDGTEDYQATFALRYRKRG